MIEEIFNLFHISVDEYYYYLVISGVLERSIVLEVVSEYINNHLNPWKHNVYDLGSED